MPLLRRKQKQLECSQSEWKTHTNSYLRDEDECWWKQSDGLTAEGALGMVSLGGHFASGQPALSLRFSEFHTPWWVRFKLAFFWKVINFATAAHMLQFQVNLPSKRSVSHPVGWGRRQMDSWGHMLTPSQPPWPGRWAGLIGLT